MTDRTAREALRQLLNQIDLGEAVRRRVVQQAISKALVEYWLHRGAVFRAVGTPECDLIAQNCLDHARLQRVRASRRALAWVP
jgi:hypothetical protein